MLCESLYQQAIDNAKKEALAARKSEMGEVPAVLANLQEIRPIPSDAAGVIELQEELEEALNSAGISRYHTIDIWLPRGTKQGVVREVQRAIIDQGGPRVSISTIKRIWREYCLYTEDAEI